MLRLLAHYHRLGSIIIRENDYALDEGSRFSRCLFVEPIDDKLLMAMNMVCLSCGLSRCQRFSSTFQHDLTVALKTERYDFWFQLAFEYELEFWGLVNTITRVRNLQVNRHGSPEGMPYRRKEHEFTVVKDTSMPQYKQE